MKKRLEALTIERDDLIDVMGEVEKNIGSVVIPSLNDLAKTVSGEKVLSSNVLFSSLKLKDDSEFFKRLVKIMERYNKIVPTLKGKINDELPDVFTANTSNINIKLVISLVSEGVFFADNMTDITAYLINKFYTKSGSDLEPSVSSKLGSKLMLLIKIMPEMEKARLDKVVDTIGNVPTIKTLKQEDTSVIPTEIVLGFFKTTFKISDRDTQTFLKRALGFFNYKQEAKVNKTVAKNFIGNPIYHLRLFLIDLEMLRFERLKESRRLMELRILELKQLESGTVDPKLTKSIKYYENELNKLDMKIERYLRG